MLPKVLRLEKSCSAYSSLAFLLFILESDSFSAPVALWDSKLSSGCTLQNLKRCCMSYQPGIVRLFHEYWIHYIFCML